MRPFLVLCCLVAPLFAQQGPVNLDFREIAIEGKPAGWSSTADPSYSVTMIEDCRAPNSRCVMFHSQSNFIPSGRGMFLQSFDAGAFRGKQVRYRAWLRSEAAMSRAQLFMRVDLPTGSGFNDYSPKEKSDFSTWTPVEIAGKINPDATRITIGVRLNGMGGVAISDPDFELVENQP